MHSLFEEQIAHEQHGRYLAVEMHEQSSAEALSYFHGRTSSTSGPRRTWSRSARSRAAVSVPVIGVAQRHQRLRLIQYAKLIEQAGADALELNVYYLATNARESGHEVEQRTLGAAKLASRRCASRSS